MERGTECIWPTFLGDNEGINILGHFRVTCLAWITCLGHFYTLWRRQAYPAGIWPSLGYAEEHFLDKIFIELYSMWASSDWGRLAVGLSHPFVEAEAGLFSDPGNQPAGSSTLLERNQSQIYLSLCRYTQTRVSTDASSSYSLNFIWEENNDNFGQVFHPWQNHRRQDSAAGYAKDVAGLLHRQPCSPAHGRFSAVTCRGQA